MKIPIVDLRPEPRLASQLNAAYDRVLGSGQYIGGKEVEAFEDEWAEYCEVKYCVGVGNGFDALRLICEQYRQRYSGTPMAQVSWKTCLPTWAAVKQAGWYGVPPGIPYYKMAVVVHLYGFPGFDIMSSDGVPLIEDCAQAHGAKYNGVLLGKFGKAASWSFYPTKNLGAIGDAGAVTTDDPDIAAFVRHFAHYDDQESPGINSRLDPLQAAFLRVKLPYLNNWNKRRTTNAEAYMQTIRTDGCVVLPQVPENSQPSWHQFAIETNNRDGLASFLAENGVQTLVHYPAVPYPSRWFIPEAIAWTQRTLSLPVAPHVTQEDCWYIGGLINQWMEINKSCA